MIIYLGREIIVYIYILIRKLINIICFPQNYALRHIHSLDLWKCPNIICCNFVAQPQGSFGILNINAIKSRGFIKYKSIQ